MYRHGAEWLLAVERSTRLGSVALYCGSEQVLLQRAPAGPETGTELCAAFDQAMAAARIRPEQLTRLGAGLGPGSFSGIRATIGFLQGLSIPSGTQFEGVSSAAALALAGLRERPRAERVVVVGDARRNTLWTVVYSRNGRTLREVRALALVSPSELRDVLPKDVPVLTPDWDRLGEALGAAVDPTQLFHGFRAPGADAVAELLLDPDAPRIHPPLPLYLHPAVVTR